MFEEDKCWDWDQSHEEAIIIDLEWGDNEGKETIADSNERANGADLAERCKASPVSVAMIEENKGANRANIAGRCKESPVSVALTDENLSSSNEGRRRAPLVWMRDYVSEEGLSKDDEITANFISLSTNDPICYNDAVKDEKW